MDFAFLGFYFLLILLSICVHEVAHGWVAYRCGDTTAKDAGRLTLNPIVHIDLFLSIILPILSMLTMGFAFGAAKPVPVNVHYLRRGVRDHVLVTAAGPASNLAIALAFGMLMHSGFFGEQSAENPAMVMMGMVVVTNIALALFNLVPIPPLDGSHLLRAVLPEPVGEVYSKIGFLGLVLVVLLFQIPEVSSAFSLAVVRCWKLLGHSTRLLNDITTMFYSLKV